MTPIGRENRVSICRAYRSISPSARTTAAPASLTLQITAPTWVIWVKPANAIGWPCTPGREVRAPHQSHLPPDMM